MTLDAAPEDFSDAYFTHRFYAPCEVRKKHIREFTRNIWEPAGFQASHRVVDLGCGTGLFLAYLKAMGVTDFNGVEIDPKVKEVMPADIAEKVETAGIEDFLGRDRPGVFDRIVLLDVLEHFPLDQGFRMLRSLGPMLADGGRIVVRVPNCSSPWGLQVQLGDLTHKAMYAPGNIEQMALAAGLECEATLPYTRGSRLRRLTSRAVEGALDRLLTDPPPIWTPNFITIISNPNHRAQGGA